MAYYNRNRYHRQAKPQARGIVVKYAGKCACCGAEIKAGESAMYYPVWTIAGITESRIAHIGGLDGTSARCTAEIRAASFPEYAAELARREAERRAVNDYAGDGLDSRWEDDGAAICGR
jgi:hypothetical protein